MTAKAILRSAAIIFPMANPVGAQEKSLKQCIEKFGDGTGCQITRSGPYPFDCFLNDRLIRCAGYKNNLIRWEDGVVTRIWLVREATKKDKDSLADKKQIAATALYTDERAGKWWMDSYPNGNQLWINEATGNSILVPLRPACQPPLEGVVGFCLPPEKR